MSDPQTAKPVQYEPRRDQTMPRYTYSPATAQNHTVTVRSGGTSGSAQAMVLVNGQATY